MSAVPEELDAALGDDSNDLSDAYDDLDLHLIGDLPEVVADHESAERAMRALARLYRKRDLARSVAQSVIDRTHEHLAEQLKRLDTSFLESNLIQFHSSVLAQDPKAKTIHLPSGTLKARAGQPRWEIDEEKFLAWAADNAPDLVRTKSEPDRAAIKAELKVVDGFVLNAAGERIPGIGVEPAVVAYKVEPGE